MTREIITCYVLLTNYSNLCPFELIELAAF